MIIQDAALATLELGLPVALLTWLLFLRLYETGQLARGLDKKTMKSSMKALRKASNSEKAGHRVDYLLHRKWMKFGGGFYGIAALWTLIVIEVRDLVHFLANLDQAGHMFDQGLLSLLVSMLVNQITNFVQALVWFGQWVPEDGDLPLWLLVAYLGYLAGLNLANIPLARLRSIMGNIHNPMKNKDI